MEAVLEDPQGMDVSGCWFSPLKLVPDSKQDFASVDILEKVAERYVLLLPNMAEHNYTAGYYVVGDDWTDRNKDGVFRPVAIVDSLFEDWLNISD
jgi:hypothetical protein